MSGLKYVPENESIFIFRKGNVDAWGISATAEDKHEIKCYIKSAESSTPIESIGGRQIVPSFTISFNGKVPVGVGDYVEVEGIKKVVLNKKESKDLSRKVLITRITV